MDRNRLLDWLGKLLPAHSPGGDEGEVDRLLLPHFREHCRDVRLDAAENLLGMMPGRGERPPLIVAAHKDELGMIVKRVEPDGSLRVEPLGGIPPWKYGEGPVEILAASGTLTGIMRVGSLHSTEETPRVERAREQPLDWTMIRVFTGRTPEELAEAGAGPGTRVVVARERKGPVLLKGCVAGFGMDDKAGLAIMLEAMRALADGPPPVSDLYFLASSSEEQMGCGATVAAGYLPAQSMLALEIGPVEPEYGLALDARPIVWYRDSTLTYTKSFCDELVAVGKDLGCGAQRAVYGHAGSDASCSRSAGQVGRVACLSFPALNTHGFEVATVDGILNTFRILLAYLRG